MTNEGCDLRGEVQGPIPILQTSQEVQASASILIQEDLLSLGKLVITRDVTMIEASRSIMVKIIKN